MESRKQTHARKRAKGGPPGKKRRQQKGKPAPAANDNDIATVSDDAVDRLMAECRHDPLDFVKRAFPWGAAGTPLAAHDGPYAWQAEVLAEIGAALRGGSGDVVQHAIASGHGVGKSALVAWVLLWGLATFRGARLSVAANTEQQLRTKTWPELARWFQLMAGRERFAITETALAARRADDARNWRIDRVTWSAYNTVAFQGLHNQGGRIVLVFDEASAIPDQVWEASEGALTDAGAEIVWLVAGNPTHNTGRFRECFGARKARWRTRQVDSRNVPGTSARQIANWIADYGADSDFVRVRVKGEFPRAGSHQFIPSDLIEAASRREAQSHAHEAMVLGVDVARHGDDMTVIWPRRGRDARTWAPVRLRIPDLMQVAGRVAEQARLLHADAVFVDMGMGAGVVDRLVQMGVRGVVGVEFGAAADGTRYGDLAVGAFGRYANKRAQMWANMRAWLQHGAIPDDAAIRADLEGPEYAFNARDEILLERKEDMKRRGLASPDLADALALTFAHFVHPAAGGFLPARHLTDHD